MVRRVNVAEYYYEPESVFKSLVYELGDYNNRQSSLQCDVTNWTIHILAPLWELTEHINVLANQMLMDRHGCVEVCEMWGAVYRTGDYAVIHQHPDPNYVQSFCYYIDCCDQCAPLIFPDPERPWLPPANVVTPTVGKLVFFSPTDLHYVPPHTCDHDRVIISGNIQRS